MKNQDPSARVEQHGVLAHPAEPGVPELTIPAQALAHGARLWEREPDRCCELRKIAPLRAALAGFDAWITAIRRDQTPERANAQVVEHDRKFGLVKVNPLVGVDARRRVGHIYANDVPYNALHERGYPSIGCEPCTSAVAPARIRAPVAGAARRSASAACTSNRRLQSRRARERAV